MGRTGFLTKNYFLDPAHVSDYKFSVYSAMTEADGVLGEASGLMGEVLALTGRVPSKAQYGALSGMCFSAQAAIAIVNFFSYGRKVDCCLQNLLDHDDHTNNKCAQAMGNNIGRAKRFGEGCRSVSALLGYVGQRYKRNMKLLGATRLAKNILNKEEGEDRSTTREETIRRIAAKKAGLLVDSNGIPSINSAYEAQEYQRQLKDIKSGNYTNSQLAAYKAGIYCSDSSKIPVINNATDAKRYMEALEQLRPHSVGYLSYGANGIVDNSDEGFFRLYSEPTLECVTMSYNFADLYRQTGISPNGALQGFGNKVQPNPENERITYGNQKFDSTKGTLMYNGIERYAIAIGPALQDPEFDLNTKRIDANDMIYGTCVDICIELDGETYYIPAIIVDVKEHTALEGAGMIQTDVSFSGEDKREVNKKPGNIVEFYVQQYENKDTQEGNKSLGLSQFDENSSILIYGKNVLN